MKIVIAVISDKVVIAVVSDKNSKSSGKWWK